MRKIASIMLSVVIVLSTTVMQAHATDLGTGDSEQSILNETDEVLGQELQKDLFTASIKEAESSLKEGIKINSKFLHEEDKEELPRELKALLETNKSKAIIEAHIEPKMNEPGSGFNDAATGFSNKLVSQGFQKTDQRYHFYQFEVRPGKEYSFLLTNLISDYDLLVSDGQSVWGMPQAGNASEEFYMEFAGSGTLYVIVDSNGNKSSSNYFLYFGDFLRNGSVASSEISYNFGSYNPSGLDQYPPPPHKYSQTYLVDFANDTRVPGNSLITKISVDHNTTGYWRGLYHTLVLAQDQNKPINKEANLPIMYYVNSVEEAEYTAKQQMLLQAHVVQCNSMTWNPTVNMNYVYGMNIDNLWWLVYNN